MFKKTITYVDYDGNPRTEDFYFNLNKAELLEWELSVDGGLSKFVEKIVTAQDGKQLIALFKKLVLDAYGEKSLDGRRFIKTPETKAAFAETEAYSEIFLELATDAEAAAAFVNNLVPNTQDHQQPRAGLKPLM